MAKRENVNRDTSQEDINLIWRDAWRKESGGNVFKNRFFLESYPVLKKYIDIQTGEILEIGSGTGRYGLGVARDFPGVRVFLTDILDESLGLISKLADSLGIGNFDVKREDALSLSFADNSFDIVFSDAVIQHLPDDVLAVKEMTRVLKPGGKIILSVVNRWNPHSLYKLWVGPKYPYGMERSYTKKDLRKLLNTAGLEVEAEDGFYAAYGIYRLKRYHRIFSVLGRAINKLVKIFDKYSNRFFSRNFGFEILIVGSKRQLH